MRIVALFADWQAKQNSLPHLSWYPIGSFVNSCNQVRVGQAVSVSPASPRNGDNPHFGYSLAPHTHNENRILATEPLTL